MNQKKRVISFVLALFFSVCLFWNVKMDSSAAEEVRIGTFKYGEYDIKYQYVTEFKMYFSSGVTLNVTTDYPCYAISTYSSDPNDVYIFLVSEVPNTYRSKGSNGSSVNQAFTAQNGMYRLYVGSSKSNNLATSYRGGIGDTVLVDPFINYMKSDSFDDLLEHVPDFDNYYHQDNDIWVKDLRAQLENDTLYATWDGLDGSGAFMLQGYKNTYIRLYLTFIKENDSVNVMDDEYYSPDFFYTKIPEGEFSVELSEFDVPEGYRLNFMIAIPYWYFNDDVESTLFRGKQSLVFFNADGSSDRPLIKDADDIYNPLNPSYSNWNAITNFTGDYFYNMGNVMDNTFNSWDSSGMDADNVRLNESLLGFSQEEDVIMDAVSGNIESFDFDTYLNFSDKVRAGISFGSSLINKFFAVSGDFTILFVVGCVMVFVFIVVGIWRFSK